MFYRVGLGCIFYKSIMLGWLKKLDEADPTRPSLTPSWYHKDVGHTTEECVMLKDEIEKLIHNGYLHDYVCDRRAKLRGDQNKAEPHREIRTIFGRPYFVGET